MNNLDVDAVVVKHYRFVDYSVRVLRQHGQNWFNAEDVCKILGFRNVRKTIKKLGNRDIFMLNYWDAQRCLPILVHEIWGYPCDLNQFFVNDLGLSTLLVHSAVPSHNIYKRWLINNLMPNMASSLKHRVKKVYKQHKLFMMTAGWRMIKRTKRSAEK